MTERTDTELVALIRKLAPGMESLDDFRDWFASSDEILAACNADRSKRQMMSQPCRGALEPVVSMRELLKCIDAESKGESADTPYSFINETLDRVVAMRSDLDEPKGAHARAVIKAACAVMAEIVYAEDKAHHLQTRGIHAAIRTFWDVVSEKGEHAT